MKTKFHHVAQSVAAWPSLAQTRAHAVHWRGPTQARPIRATAAHDREAHALRLFYENDPDLPTNHPETHGTIPTVNYFADKPSEEPVFATATPSAPARAHQRGGADIGRSRQPYRPLPTPKCEPMLT